jgi:hypothetical protein
MIQLGEKYYTTSSEFHISMKLITLIKMCLNNTYIKVCIGKYLSVAHSIHHGLKQGISLSPVLFKVALEYASRKVQ